PPKDLKQHSPQQPPPKKPPPTKPNHPQPPYIPATNAPLNAVATTTTITAHVSPDAGLATLQAFIAGTKQSLIIGMYDFTSGAILKTFEGVLTGNKTLQMVLDDPAPNPKRDQTDDQTVQALNSALGHFANITRALERQDPYAASGCSQPPITSM